MSEVAPVGISTYQTYWMVKKTSNGTFEKVIDITDYGDLIPDPNLIDVTTLSHGRGITIPGIERAGDGIPLTANYTKENWAAVKELEGHQYEYGIWFGGTSAGVPDGHNGKFTWTGDVKASLNGAGVDEAHKMGITCTPSTNVEWSDGTT